MVIVGNRVAAQKVDQPALGHLLGLIADGTVASTSLSPGMAVPLAGALPPLPIREPLGPGPTHRSAGHPVTIKDRRAVRKVLGIKAISLSSGPQKFAISKCIQAFASSVDVGNHAVRYGLYLNYMSFCSTPPRHLADNQLCFAPDLTGWAAKWQ